MAIIMSFTRFYVIMEYQICSILTIVRLRCLNIKKKNTKKVEEDTFTQFGYACKQLGIEIKTTSVAQAKGRVERAFQILQSRLPVELRLAGIYAIKEANAFLTLT